MLVELGTLMLLIAYICTTAYIAYICYEEKDYSFMLGWSLISWVGVALGLISVGSQ